MKLRNNIALMTSIALFANMDFNTFAAENKNKTIHTNNSCRHIHSGVTSNSFSKKRKSRIRTKIAKQSRRRNRGR